MKEFVLGVDGGGTKTHCALFDIEGNRIDLANWGPTNHEVLSGGFMELKEELAKMLSFILSKNHICIGDIGKCIFGISGVDTEYQHKKISEILKELGIDEFILCNDGYLGVKAGCKKGYGICAINGTGYSVVGVDPRGRMFQIGGQGDLTADKGGGAFLGMTAIGSIYNFLFKGGEYTFMKDILFSDLSIKSKYDFKDVITEGLSTRSINVSKLCRIVFLAANKGDKVAIEILNGMGSEYARSINCMINELEFNGVSNLDIILAGSVFVKGESPLAIEKLKQDVLSRNLNRSINFNILKKPPIAGAIIWALNGIGDTDCLYDKVMDQF